MLKNPRKTSGRQGEVSGRSTDVSSPDRVVTSILGGIRSGRYVPGQKLIEADLTHDLAVSRGPVREALKRLAAEGVVTLTRHRGAYIRALTRTEADETLVVLEVLCGLLARLAADAVSQGDNADRMQEATRWLDAYHNGTPVQHNLSQRRHFYETLAIIGGNRQLSRVMVPLQIDILRLQIQPYLTPAARRAQMRGYAEVTRAVLAGNAALAERSMRKHIRRTRARYARLPDDAFRASVLFDRSKNQ